MVLKIGKSGYILPGKDNTSIYKHIISKLNIYFKIILTVNKKIFSSIKTRQRVSNKYIVILFGIVKF